LEEAQDQNRGISRRRFFLLTWGSFFVAVFLSGIASIRFLFPNVLYEPETRVEVEKPEEYPLNGVVFHPEYRFYILRDEKGIYAMSGICTHLACLVNWIDSKKAFLCSCHGSVFSKNGKVTKPPAKLDLRHYEVSINRKGRIVVNLKKPVDRDFRLAV
jgi:cytochrome b6-f complex iron-sulfur subunit